MMTGLFQNGSDMHTKFRALAVGALIAASCATKADACDMLVSNLITNAVRPAIKTLGCGDLARAGMDVADHALTEVCYSSNATTSTIDMTAQLHCSTGSGAFISASVSETITAHATINGGSCQVTDVRVNASGELGELALSSLNAEGAARTALQDAMDKVCKP
ncbi:hypothetical protein [Rhizobium leguminosarum]|uniref:hypothetical protein n=1 Tax=Rhizobium leguminosarum TaxID=384 RepID=UPI0013DD7745|nr:hypothetical protein [Rhizobium leguminosarum]NEK35627.1 hypothetical protein [Rhizobium leguminosarum]